MANKKKEVAPVAKINDTDLKGKFIIRKLLIDNPLLSVKCRITKSFCDYSPISSRIRRSRSRFAATTKTLAREDPPAAQTSYEQINQIDCGLNSDWMTQQGEIFF